MSGKSDGWIWRPLLSALQAEVGQALFLRHLLNEIAEDSNVSAFMG